MDRYDVRIMIKFTPDYKASEPIFCAQITSDTSLVSVSIVSIVHIQSRIRRMLVIITRMNKQLL
jgi:hypothetical protein